jgi:hypothetical protein
VIEVCHLLLVGYWIALLFNSEDEDITFLRSVSELLLDHMASYPGRWYSSDTSRTFAEIK